MRFLCFIFCLFTFPAALGAADNTAEIPLQPHKALYQIKLTATHSGAQIVNVSGKMFYELNATCEAWITDHRFNLRYDYVETPSVKVKSNFSTYETFDGKEFNFTSTRRRNGTIIEELKGHAESHDDGGVATFSQPPELSFALSETTSFPMEHTLALIRKARQGDTLYQNTVFDGSDDEGPVSINAFIGGKVNALALLPGSEKINVNLLNTKARRYRLAFFPMLEDTVSPDYEMEMVLHDNGVVSDMLVEYDTFSVTQTLVALEKKEKPACIKGSE